MTTLIDGVVGVAGVCSYTCKLGTFLVILLTLHIPIFEKYLDRELWKNLSNFGHYIKMTFYVSTIVLNMTSASVYGLQAQVCKAA